MQMIKQEERKKKLVGEEHRSQFWGFYFGKKIGSKWVLSEKKGGKVGAISKIGQVKLEK